MKFWDELRRTQCHTRVFVAWFLVSIGLCIIYAFVVYASLVSKNVIPFDPGPDFVPFTNIPKRYNVTLRFDSTSNHSVADYSGEMRLNFLVREGSQRFFIYSGKFIKIGKIELYDSDGKTISILKGVYNPKTEIQTFIPQANLSSDHEYSIDMSFTGKLNQDGGPMPFSYVSVAGEKRFGVYFSSPQSAPKGLRYLFPSLDASQFPAIFDLKILHKNTLRALSNFASVSSSEPNYLIDSFIATTRLYPAQLGLVLCDFPFQKQNVNGTKITIYYRTDVLNKVNLRRLQQFMDKSSLTIGKLDAVVIPSSSTVNLPGLSLLNEEETIAENSLVQSIVLS